MTSPIGRRDFLSAVSAGIGAIALPGIAESRVANVAGIGYREVEFAGLFDKEPKKVSGWLRKYGLTSPASHIALERLTANLQSVVDEVQTSACSRNTSPT